MLDKYYVTTPIFYPNAHPHIGHAYTMISADILSRFYRLHNKDVLFLTGTDEHGLKMQQTAEKAGLTPQELADANSAVFRELLQTLNCQPDDFLRTTEERHAIACQALWNKMLENGDIYLANYAGWYSVQQEAYFDESEITLDEEGNRYEPLGSLLKWQEEESYFFRLSAYGDKLLEYYKNNPDAIAPSSRRNEIISFIKSGLKDLSISRTSFTWGVKVPNDDKHIMYVWVDALTNYLTATGYPNINDDKAGFWPANVQLIGKDITRFHAVYWPAFLMSAGLALPKRVFSHGFILQRDVKISKSLGNVIDPFQLVEQYNCDAVRYFLIREISFGHDGAFNHNQLISRVNADLANDLGNLAQRCLSMLYKNCDSKVPAAGQLTAIENDLLKQSQDVFSKLEEMLDNQSLTHALAEIMSFTSDINKYFAAQEPWALRKVDLDRFHTVLCVTIELLRRVGILLQAFIPTTAKNLLDLLAIPADRRDFSYLFASNEIAEGTSLPEPVGIFPRLLAPVEQ